MRWLAKMGVMLVTGVTAAGAQGATTARIPVCTGLTVVTGIAQDNGDYESIKTITSVSPELVRIKYATERTVSDIWTNQPPHLERVTLNRNIRTEDLASGKLYLQVFYDKMPETVPGTTSIGVSAAVLNALKSQGQAEIGIFIPFAAGEFSVDRNVHPNVYDHQMISTIRRVGPGPVMMPVMVNDQLVKLPAIQAAGNFFSDSTEFFFLDDPANPLVLKFRIGIGKGAVVDSALAKVSGAKVKLAGGDRDLLQVIKISYRCAESELAGGVSSLEKSLASGEKVDIYDIFFSFDSDRIREESEPRLKEIAEVMGRHPDWKLGVAGHTDNVASDRYNLELSQRRAAAVKDALVKRYRIDPTRLTTAGYGESVPRDSNETLEGRARNRRVELMRR